MKTIERYLGIAAMISGVFVFSVLIFFGYLRSVFVSPNGDGSVVVESPLLPDGWETYRGEIWSVGYPDDYEVKERKADSAVSFVPNDADEKKTYFLVQKESQSLSEIKIARSTEDYPDPVDVIIANYEGIKYTFGTGRVEFFIAHDSTVYLLASDDPESNDIGAMFATFTFTE